MELKREAEEHLRNRLIPFWMKLKDTVNGGYIGLVDFDLQPDAHAPKGSIYTSRILWFFSTAYRLLGDEELLECAHHAYAFLERFWDGEHGGVYWSVTYDGKPLDTMKHTYAQSFAIYALSAYAMASGDDRALRRAESLYGLVESRMRDEDGYLEAFECDFRPSGNEKLSDNPRLLARGVVASKTMNTLLHIMEAYTQLYLAGRDGCVLQSLRSLLLTLRDQVYNQEANRLEVFLDAHFHSLFDMQSYGHDIEASWLIDLAADTALPEQEREEVKRWTTELARGVCARAFGENGLLNERVEGKDDPTLVWWVQAETMIGLANLWQKTGEAQWLTALQRQWETIRTKLVDPRPDSEWFWCLTGEGVPERRPFAEPWKAPYHNGRMCMELMTRL